jgi:hypothetical protein
MKNKRVGFSMFLYLFFFVCIIDNRHSYFS